MTGAEAVHPGYGFLAEDRYFAEICEKYELSFIGPTPQVIATMANKVEARQAMAAYDIPVLPGTHRTCQTPKPRWRQPKR